MASTNKQQNDKVAAAIVAAMSQVQADPEVRDDGKMTQQNTKGEMLMVEMTVAKRIGAPDPLCITINEEFRWVKRGKQVIVPWYVAEFLSTNIERKYRQEKDEHGVNQTIAEDMLAEPFQFRMIDPAPGSKVGGQAA